MQKNKPNNSNYKSNSKSFKKKKQKKKRMKKTLEIIFLEINKLRPLSRNHYLAYLLKKTILV
jgi:hypothetical protein